MKIMTTIVGITIIVNLMIPLMASAKDSKGDVIYKYKKYERFDLGNLKVKGSIIAPGDLSVMDRERKVFNMDLLNRKIFDRESFSDIINLR